MKVTFPNHSYPYQEWKSKSKYYPHFDGEFALKRLPALIQEINTKQRLSHNFYPFIRYKQPKFRRNANGKLIEKIDKPRYITHTARIDANIYSYYRNILMDAYERLLHQLGLSDCVIAYRKIPIEPNSDHGKCNLHFANEAINEIKQRHDRGLECAAITMDISGFFDNLDHKLIKKQWCHVMDFKEGLPKDHYSVFKNIAKYRYITAEEIENILGLKLKKIPKKQICSPKVFREKILPKLSSQNEAGIPQGTPISDVIANFYLLDFDIIMNRLAKKYDGYYRRYSDDILFICPLDKQSKMIKLIPWLIKRIGRTLKIGEHKTLISLFQTKNNELQCQTYNHDGKIQNKPFEYLGLSFDGKCIRLRTSTISSFYIKLNSYIKNEVRKAYKNLAKRGQAVSADDLYKVISFNKVRNQFMKIRVKDKKNQFKGNFRTYVQKALEVTGEFNINKFYKKIKLKRTVRKYCELRIQKEQKRACQISNIS